MNEIWKDIYYTDSITGEIVDYMGLYQVSNLGRVKSLERVVERTRNGKTFYLTVPGRILAIKNNGVYPTVCLWKNNKDKYLLLHRIVASMFIPNPHGYEIVNHKDCNPLNSVYTNLEWCDVSYNVTYNGASRKRAEKMRREVLQYSLDGKFIKKWNSYKDAANALNLNRGDISNCVLGTAKSHGNFMWVAATGIIEPQIKPYVDERILKRIS